MEKQQIINNLDSLYVIFRERIAKWAKSDYIGTMYYQLFSLKSDKDLQEELEYLYTLYKGALSNQHAKEVLYIIALYQVKTVLNDITSLSSRSFSTEHMMPKAWTENWTIKDKSTEAKNRRNQKLLTLGNLTIITKNLNSKLRNRSWKNKIADLKQYSALPITTNYTGLSEWNETEIDKRANDLKALAIKIWTKH